MLHPTQTAFSRPALQRGEDTPASSWAHASGWELRKMALRRVSCVVVCSDQGTALRTMLPRLSDLLTEFGYPWELVLVDVESTDPLTPRLLERWRALPGVRALRIDRAVNRLHGLALGLSQARGDVVISCTPGDERWVTLIPEMLLQWESGAKLICPTPAVENSGAIAPSWADHAPQTAPWDSAQDTDLPTLIARLALLDRQVIDRLRIAT